MEVLKTLDLCKSYGSGAARVDALKDVNISIEAGQFVSVVGPSGSGKSTLLHLLGGVDRPTSGQVMINGSDIYSLKEKDLAVFRRRNVGFIFQFYNLLPVFTAEENIALPLLLDHKKVGGQQTEELLGVLGLKKRRHHLPSELSGGQQQRVSIGRALAANPAIILADEPTGNLDRRNGEEILELLKLAVRKYHQTVVVITHDMNIAAQTDRIIAIEDGLVVRDEVTQS